MNFWVGNWRMERCKIQVPSSSCLETWVFIFYFFEKKELSCSSNYSLESLFLFWILTKAKLLPSFLLSSNLAYVELRAGVERHVCFAYIVKSKTRSKQKRVIQSDQDVQVCGNVFFGGWTPFHDSSLFFIFLGCGLSFSILFSFFWTCLVGMWHTLFGYASLLLFFLFFLTYLLSMWHTFFGYASFISSSSLFFFHSPHPW